ncbi:MAG: ATP-dependent DNA ligase [Myxococcales bacterium]|nr:ATP-dependent DNA ligase [Myxococcales bacterium]MCB9733582.1 ATP-dependent DNA ligase [Deltaproteobacteria bacterium]
MHLEALVETSRAVTATRSRKKKQAALAALLGGLARREIEVAVSYLIGVLPQGRIGVGPRTLTRAFPGGVAEEASLTLADVDRAFDEVAGIAGPGAEGRRVERLRGLLSRANAGEQDFLARLLMGELRQGANEGLVLAGVAEAAELDEGALRRAAMLAGGLPPVAVAALVEGAAGLAAFRLELFRPVLPMLADTAEDIADALARIPAPALEPKIDGARVLVHKDGERVVAYSRQQNDVTASIPEVADLVRALPARRLLLDGEVIALSPDGRPRPFQETMRRFGRRLDVDAMRLELPLSTFFFDCLLVDDDELLDRAADERAAALARIVPAESRVERLVTADPSAAQAFLDRVVAAGHEGIMVKDRRSRYEAGSRGASWLKLKPTMTLDLAVLAAEWGSGRRKGWLSNLHLGARDEATGDFVMLGKTFKGLTDETLIWQTEALLERETSREGHVVRVRPELVVEIAFNELQRSPRYPGGLALRFARVKGYRADKGPGDADTMETVRELATNVLSGVGPDVNGD